MKDRNPRVEEARVALEEEMKLRYGSNGPSVLKPPVEEMPIYRTTEATVFFKKSVKWFQWVGALISFCFLFFPVSGSRNRPKAPGPRGRAVSANLPSYKC